MMIDETIIPLRMRHLPRDARGFPVPWFVWWSEGKPDFRLIAPGKIERAQAGKRCWLCGERLGRNLAFVIGPMCCINRVSSEPPSHRECAVYAAQVCPFLSNPKMHRQGKDLPDGYVEPAGIHSPGNPGIAVIWITRDFLVFAARHGRPGVMFRLGEPFEVLWYREGVPANRRQAEAAMVAGLPKLMELAFAEGAAAVEALKIQTRRAYQWLPPDENDDAAGVGSEAVPQGRAVAVTISIPP